MAKVTPNPSDDGELELPAGYKPMSVGQRRLEVPEREGWHRHWFRGNPANIQKALQAGYRFVEKDEVKLNNFDLAGFGEGEGADLGTRVSQPSGDSDDKLYLMECPQRLYEYAQGLHMQINHETAAALKGGTVGVGKAGETKKDVENRYQDVTIKGKDMFTPRTPR